PGSPWRKPTSTDTTGSGPEPVVYRWSAPLKIAGVVGWRRRVTGSGLPDGNSGGVDDEQVAIVGQQQVGSVVAVGVRVPQGDAVPVDDEVAIALELHDGLWPRAVRATGPVRQTILVEHQVSVVLHVQHGPGRVQVLVRGQGDGAGPHLGRC